MKNLLTLLTCALALTLSASCFTAHHFTGDATRYDGLYFGPQKAAPLEPPLDASKWRNYALFGVVPWSEPQTRFAGERLAQVGSESRPMTIVVTSEQTLLNGIANIGLAVLIGPFGPLLFTARSIEVEGWQG